jgi:hypothetical protein
MSEESNDDVRHAAKAAAAAAAVGAAVGLARTLAERAEEAAQRARDDHDEPEGQEEEAFVDEEPPAGRDEREEDPEPRPMKGADARTVRRMTDRAREFLQELSSVDVESVSGLDRTQSGWLVTLEAVEVRRIPESTDVLATYEVELDDDGDLARYERLRRYARAQSDRGGAWARPT